MPLRVIYTDVTNDPSAWSHLTDAPEFAAALKDLGFSSIGLIQATLSDRSWERPLRTALHPEDAEEFIRRNQQSEVVNILANSGQTPALGKIDWLFGELVSFETILDNGAIVETTMKPIRSPRARPAGSLTNLANLFGAIFLAASHLLIGKPPEWPHPNYPLAGYFVELVSTRDTLILWQRHQERVAQVRERFHTTVRQHNSLAIYRTIRRRLQQTQEIKTLLFIPVLILVTALFVLYVPQLLISISLSITSPENTFGFLLSTLLTTFVAILGMVMVIRLINSYLPVPLTSLDALMKREPEKPTSDQEKPER
jgi:hypothetical protein